MLTWNVTSTPGSAGLFALVTDNPELPSQDSVVTTSRLFWLDNVTSHPCPSSSWERGSSSWECGPQSANVTTQTLAASTWRVVDWSVLLLAGIVLAGLVGNILVCLAILVEKKLQNITNSFLMSLAVADLLVSVLVMPCCIIHQIMGYWPFGLVLCDMWQVADVMLCTSSIMHMCVISIDRYICIKNPLKTRTTSRHRVALKIAIVWLIALAIASPIILLGVYRPKDLLTEDLQCGIFNQYFVIYGSLAAFFIPLLLMLATYSLTIHILRKKVRQGKKQDGGGLRRMMSRKGKSYTNLRKHKSTFSNAKGGIPGNQGKCTVAELEPLNGNASDAEPGIARKTSKHIFSALCSAAHGLALPIYQPLNVSAKEQADSGPKVCDHRQDNGCAEVSAVQNCILSNKNRVGPSQNGQDEESGVNPELLDNGQTADTNNVATTPANANHLTGTTENSIPAELKSNLQPIYQDFTCQQEPTANSNTALTMPLIVLCDASPEDPNSSIPDEPLPSEDVPPGAHIHKQCQNVPGASENFNAVLGGYATGGFEADLDGSSHSNISEFCDYSSDSSNVICGKWNKDTHHMSTDDILDMDRSEQSNSADLNDGSLDQPRCSSSQPGISHDREEPIGSAKSRNVTGSLPNVPVPPKITLNGEQLGSIDSLNVPTSVTEKKRNSCPNTKDSSWRSGGSKSSQKKSAWSRLSHPDTSASFLMQSLKKTAWSRLSHPNFSINGRKNEETNLQDQQTKNKCPPSPGPPRFKALVKKHSAAFRVAAILTQRRETLHKKEMRTVRTEQKAVKVLGTMFAIFVICWAPFFSFNLAMGICYQNCVPEPTVFIVFLWLGYVSSILNPIIYTIFNKTFKKTFAHLIMCKFCGKQPANIKRAGSLLALNPHASPATRSKKNTEMVLLNNTNNNI